MEWVGMMWDGMEWNRTEWNGMTWNGLEWNGKGQGKGRKGKRTEAKERTRNRTAIKGNDGMGQLGMSGYAIGPGGAANRRTHGGPRKCLVGPFPPLES